MRLLQKYLLEQLGMIEALRIAFQEGDGRQRALLRMKLARFWEFKQRRDKVCARGIDNDDALALFQRFDQLDTLDGSANDHCDHGEKPEPGQPVFVDEYAKGIFAFLANDRWPLRWRGCA